MPPWIFSFTICGAALVNMLRCMSLKRCGDGFSSSGLIRETLRRFQRFSSLCSSPPWA